MKKNKTLSQICIFSVMMLISSFLQQFFSMADMYFVGNYIGVKGTAAIGSSGIIITCLIGLFTGISVGMGSLMSRYYGSGETKEVYNILHTGSILSVVLSTGLMVLGYIYIYKFLEIFKVPKDIFEDAKSYAQIYILGIIPMILYNIYSATLRAIGQYKTPIYALCLGGIINIILNYIFIVRFALGVKGASIATVFSQLICFTTILLFLKYHKKNHGLGSFKSCYNKIYVSEIIKNGLYAGTQAILITFSNIIMQYYINRFGKTEIAAFSAYFKIEAFIYLPVMALGYTAMLFLSESLGKKDYDNIKHISIYSLGSGILLTLIISGIILFNGESLFYFFIKDKDVIEVGVELVKITFPFYFLYAVLDISGSLIRGSGNFKIPMLNSIICLCAIRILIVMFINLNYRNISTMVIAYPITWGLCAVLNSIYMCKQLNCIRKEIKNENM